MGRIYFDGNATTPLDPRVREAMIPYLDCGNPSSLHAEGRAAREAVERARDQVASLLSVSPREIVFTSGATEANALALLGAVAVFSPKKTCCSSIEHPSVYRLLKSVAHRAPREVFPVRSDGHVDPDVELPAEAGVVSLMLANNETGAIQPVAQVAASARALGAVVHCDAVQACGKIEVSPAALGVDLLTLSAHKMHGPKGAGALYVRRGLKIPPLQVGGPQERGLRPGTENVAAIVGLGAAAEISLRERAGRFALWERLSARFFAGLRAFSPDVRIHSAPPCLPNTVSARFPGVEGEALLMGLDLEGIAVSTGSACSSGAARPSPVLEAMGLDRRAASETVRFSMHAFTTENEVDVCLNTLSVVVKNIRSLQTPRNAGDFSRRG